MDMQIENKKDEEKQHVFPTQKRPLLIRATYDPLTIPNDFALKPRELKEDGTVVFENKMSYRRQKNKKNPQNPEMVTVKPNIRIDDSDLKQVKIYICFSLFVPTFDLIMDSEYRLFPLVDEKIKKQIPVTKKVTIYPGGTLYDKCLTWENVKLTPTSENNAEKITYECDIPVENAYFMCDQMTFNFMKCFMCAFEMNNEDTSILQHILLRDENISYTNDDLEKMIKSVFAVRDTFMKRSIEFSKELQKQFEKMRLYSDNTNKKEEQEEDIMNDGKKEETEIDDEISSNFVTAINGVSDELKKDLNTFVNNEEEKEDVEDQMN
jgi:hypothetical protein